MGTIANIVKIKISWMKGVFSSFSRFIYWGLRLAQSELGKGVNIQFPVIVEGKGHLKIENYSTLMKRCIFGLSAGSKIVIGHNTTIQREANIHAGKNANIIIGNNCSILKNAILRNGNEVVMEDKTGISSYCQIFPREPGYDGKFYLGEGSNIGDFTTIDTSDDVIIGKQVALGPYDIVYTHDHDYKSDNPAAWKGGVITGKVIINDGAWVGARVTILPGVTIGKRAIVAAGSVVTKNVEDGDIVGGIPAKSLMKK